MELAILKRYLGIKDTEQDAVLEIIMGDTEEIIRNYCNIDEVPEGLFHTSYRMAMDLYRNKNIGHEDSALSVSSVTVGDTVTSFKAAEEDSFKNSILSDYKKILNRYRKVRFG